jgi:hypothetical protein
MKDLHCHHTSNFHLETMFNTECVGMFMIHLRTKFHIPNSNGSLVNATKPKVRVRQWVLSQRVQSSIPDEICVQFFQLTHLNLKFYLNYMDNIFLLCGM